VINVSAIIRVGEYEDRKYREDYKGKLFFVTLFEKEYSQTLILQEDEIRDLKEKLNSLLKK